MSIRNWVRFSGCEARWTWASPAADSGRGGQLDALELHHYGGDGRGSRSYFTAFPFSSCSCCYQWEEEQ
ncbi:hypothetical protein SDJN03_24073, partial [Cucurbita argyrosperma subsp. sororia]